MCVVQLVALWGTRAVASSFTVNPTQIVLSSRAPSALLTLRNDSSEELRFELSVFAWDQGRNGEMQLASTDDIVFFPRLLTLGARDERKIRVGALVPPGSTEKTYRVFVEELPPLSRADASESGVRVLTKMGVPIFLQPSGASPRAIFQTMAVHEGIFDFGIENAGSAHFIPRRVRVRGRAASGLVVLDREMDGWYILAGGSRQYELPLPKEICGLIVSLSVELDTGPASIAQQLAMSPAACLP